MLVPASSCREKKIALPNLKEKLMMEAWHLLNNEEKSGLFLLPTFPLIIKL